MEGFIKIYKLYGLYKFSTDLIEHFFYPFPSFNIVRIRCRRFNCVLSTLAFREGIKDPCISLS